MTPHNGIDRLDLRNGSKAVEVSSRAKQQAAPSLPITTPQQKITGVALGLSRVKGPRQPAVGIRCAQSSRRRPVWPSFRNLEEGDALTQRGAAKRRITTVEFASDPIHEDGGVRVPLFGNQRADCDGGDFCGPWPDSLVRDELDRLL